MYVSCITLCQKFLAPTPRTFLKPNYLQQGIVGEPRDLVCLIAFSSIVQSNSLNLTWNFTSNDSRVTVIPTTITTDDSIGTIYTTVIQFAYLMQGDEENYTCTLAIDGDSTESTFNLELFSKYDWLIHMYNTYIVIKCLLNHAYSDLCSRDYFSCKNV